MRPLSSKNAIVTGSTSGIGLAIARAFAAEGANITLNGLGDADAIELERAGIERDFGVKCRYSAANMMNGQEVAALVREAEKTFGTLDILVNNAGIQYVAPIEEFPEDKWDAIIRINLTAPFHAIKAALPGMKSRNWGRIINIASVHALVASPFKSAYISAKHGLAGLTKTAALEGAAHGVTVNAIAPGYVWTSLVEKQIPDTMKARNMTEQEVKRDVLLAAQPTKGFVTVEEIAALAVFLCSDAAKQMTGAVLPVDGGSTAE
ncbi:3-hydroxybutyrate dehydrogenase [Mycoplana sp. BE70]|uniref:3-hydroxybutyrate dehydrogenase n=1 Tax=Mycoplana sp. BE70 TaxID=2817775 RepID=UPI00286068E8|nr:3-hydroxybutyrate dehydrogenase [Mycoplana sp. BE70]MDR6759366.1 3-hydroxybutyrate dehydrogenase [Mycoplana sp. BE70]